MHAFKLAAPPRRPPLAGSVDEVMEVDEVMVDAATGKEDLHRFKYLIRT